MTYSFHVFLIDPPEITFYESSYTVNETSNVTLVCRAKGVPQPRIIWTWSGSSEVLAYGEQFLIVNTKGSDNGIYCCIARNDIGLQDSKDVTLNVQSKYVVQVYSLAFFPSASWEDFRKVWYNTFSLVPAWVLKRHTFSFTEFFSANFVVN